jgi:hypothetical protein
VLVFIDFNCRGQIAATLPRELKAWEDVHVKSRALARDEAAVRRSTNHRGVVRAEHHRWISDRDFGATIHRPAQRPIRRHAASNMDGSRSEFFGRARGFCDKYINNGILEAGSHIGYRQSI